MRRLHDNENLSKPDVAFSGPDVDLQSLQGWGESTGHFLCLRADKQYHMNKSTQSSVHDERSDDFQLENCKKEFSKEDSGSENISNSYERFTSLTGVLAFHIVLPEHVVIHVCKYTFACIWIHATTLDVILQMLSTLI